MDSIIKKVANQISDMLTYWDVNLVCRFANSAALYWCNKSAEEMIDKITIPDLGLELYERNKPYILGALSGQIQTFERQLTTSSGEIQHSLVNYFPDIENGVVLGFIVQVSDVSSLKKLDEVKKQNELVTSQNTRLLNFANIVSHNLKMHSTNLATILNLISNSASDQEKGLMIGYLNNISKGFKLTLDHLFEIVKIQNEGSLNFVRIYPKKFIDQASDVLRMELEQCGGKIDCRVDPNLTLLVNPAYLESVLLNCISNSIKYRRPDKDLRIEIADSQSEGQMVLSIKDNGKGIDLEKHRENLFKMYKTFHGNKDANGIGLFISKYQMEAMGGSIEVESTVNEGATFHLIFKGQE